MLQGYKLVRQLGNGQKWSWQRPRRIAGDFIKELSPTWRPVRYVVGKATRPPRGGGPLCVFRNRELAAVWISGYEPVKIWPCEYVPVPMPRRLRGMLPRGTVLADEVTLMREEPRP